jgi:hypothetical protein
MTIYISFEQEAVVAEWGKNGDPFPAVLHTLPHLKRLDHGYFVLASKPLYDDDYTNIIGLPIGPIADDHYNRALNAVVKTLTALGHDCKICGKDY